MVDVYMESISDPEVRHIVGEQMIRKHASERTGIDPTSICIHRGVNGKPMVASLQFNLSHSGSYVVCAFADAPIGVDIERIGPARLPMAKRFFHPGEVARLTAAPKEEQDLLFFQIWTKKEAYLKRSGLGIAGGLRGFNVFEIDPALFHTAVIDDAYCLAICTSTPSPIGESPANIIWSVNDNG